MADSHHYLLWNFALVGKIIEAAGPFRLALIYLHEIVLVKVDLLESNSVESADLLSGFWMLLVVFREPVVKEKTVDQLDSLMLVLSGLASFDLVLKLFQDLDAELFSETVDLKHRYWTRKLP
jgi:hypothetical protein